MLASSRSKPNKIISHLYSSWYYKIPQPTKYHQPIKLHCYTSKTYRWLTSTWTRCSTLLIAREMKIKTTMTHPLTLVRMTVVGESTNSKCWRGCGGNETLVHCRWECKLVQPLWKTVQRFLIKWKLELPHEATISFLGIYLEIMKILIQKNACTPMLIAASFTTAKTWSNPITH